MLETIPENLDLKREVLAAIEGHLGHDAIIATNTSGIPITRSPARCKHPARFIGMHWSNPPHLVPMIEVVPGEQTAAGTTQEIVEIIAEFGYQAITEKEVPGFVENRILYAILRECLSLVERGIVSRGGHGHLRQVGDRLQACGHRPDAPARTWPALISMQAWLLTSIRTYPPPPRSPR